MLNPRQAEYSATSIICRNILAWSQLVQIIEVALLYISKVHCTRQHKLMLFDHCQYDTDTHGKKKYDIFSYWECPRSQAFASSTSDRQLFQESPPKRRTGRARWNLHLCKGNYKRPFPENHTYIVQSVFLLVPLHLQAHVQPMYITNPSSTTQGGLPLQDSTFNHIHSTRIITKMTTAEGDISRQAKAYCSVISQSAHVVKNTGLYPSCLIPAGR